MITRSRARRGAPESQDESRNLNGLDAHVVVRRKRKLSPAKNASIKKQRVHAVTCTPVTCAFLRLSSLPLTEKECNPKEDDYVDRSAAAIKQLLEAEPRFQSLVDRFGPPAFAKRDIYTSLTQAIAYQQLSGKSASTIWTRFLKLMDVDLSKGDVLTPCRVLVRSVEELRTAGLSRRKAEYILGIAKYFHDGSFDYNEADRMTDDELVEKLSALKGVGRWTVQMLLMFSLRRMDVLPTGDLGVRKGAAIMFRNGAKSPMTEKELTALFERFKGYRSFASYYMWKVKNEDFQLPS